MLFMSSSCDMLRSLRPLLARAMLASLVLAASCNRTPLIVANGDRAQRAFPDELVPPAVSPPLVDGSAPTPPVGGRRRLIAIGDHHGDVAQAKNALRIGAIMDEEDRWIGGTAIVVQTGDILDRGPDERDIIDLYERLRTDAAATGGEVINLLGNHETMTATGDYSYAIPQACEAFSDLQGLDLSRDEFAYLSDDCKKRAAAFWPGGPYAKTMAAWPIVIVRQQTLFAHGGVHPKHARRGLDAINAMTRDWLLGHAPLDTTMVSNPNEGSVDWDRTYSVAPTATDCEQLQETLAMVGATRMAVGHTVHPTIISQCDGRVFNLDVGMSSHYGGRAMVLQIKGDEITVLQ